MQLRIPAQVCEQEAEECVTQVILRHRRELLAGAPMGPCPGGTGRLQWGHNFSGDSAIMPKPWWQRPIDGDPIRIGYSESASRVLANLDHPQNPHYRAIREAIWSLETGAPERVKRVRADIPIFKFGVGDYTLVFIPHEEMRLIEVYRLTKRSKGCKGRKEA